MDSLRTPFFVTAVIAMLLAVLTELGSTALRGQTGVHTQELPTPGLGIAYLALLDGLIL